MENASSSTSSFNTPAPTEIKQGTIIKKQETPNQAPLGQAQIKSMGLQRGERNENLLSSYLAKMYSKKEEGRERQEDFHGCLGGSVG